LLIAQKIALDPTVGQARYFAQGCGVARVAWNWALAEWNRQYTARKADPRLPSPSQAAVRRLLNRLKDEQFPWMRQVTKAAPQQAIKNLGTAFTRFFKREARRPKFKKKGRHDSFRADNGPGTFHCEGKRIKLPVLGWVRMREALRFAGQPRSVTISREANRWFASNIVQIEHEAPVRENQAAGGVDLGVKALATLSDGTVVKGPRALCRSLKKLKRVSRARARSRARPIGARRPASWLASMPGSPMCGPMPCTN